MILNKKEAEFFIPDHADENTALSRTTALCFAAHQDDIEIMAYSPIVDCYGKDDKWFTGVVVTDGAGSPRSGIYEKYSDEYMKIIRAEEQKTAATIGKYSAQFLLAYSSSEVKAKENDALINEIKAIIEKCNLEVIYTHNLADKHDTHVAVAIRVIQAIRKLPVVKRPKKVYSLEVWRGLDWLNDDEKEVFDTSRHPNLAAALLGVFDSQIAGGKRYDLAALGRRCANATFFASHAVDSSDSVSYGLDITELINDETLSLEDFIVRYIDNFKIEVTERLGRFI
jgi:LmbE family N-acetylglucosaminyl deacetylase